VGIFIFWSSTLDFSHTKKHCDMSTENLALMIPIITVVGAFFMIVGLRYLENKENMAMIERGINPKEHKARRENNPSKTLKDSLLFIGAGIGLLLAMLVSNALHLDGGAETAAYFGLIAICGGGGMLAAYLYERKNPPTNNF
jgi:hypothetical protein